MSRHSFLNAKRIRDYPRLMLLTIIVILIINLAFHRGWIGSLGQLVGGDFIMFYTTGIIYKTNPSNIYNYDEQLRIQQSLVEPTKLGGLNPFMNPPYTALLYSVLTLIPLPWSLLTWTCLTILFCVASTIIIAPLIPDKLASSGLSKKQVLILILSFFPFAEGLLAGQNHGLTLLCVIGIFICAYKKRWMLSGAFAGILIYKPQLILGVLIIWAISKNIKALAGFLVVCFIWAGSFLLLNGLSPYFEYLHISQMFMLLPYTEGFPGYIIITLYGLLTSILPESIAPAIQLISQIVFVLALILVACLAYRQRQNEILPLMALGIAVPLAFSPYVQLHDLLLAVPIFVIWARQDDSSRVFYTALITYIGAFFLTFLAATTGIAFLALITILIFIEVTRWNMALLQKKKIN